MDLEEEDTEVRLAGPRCWISFGVKHGNLGNPLSEFSSWGEVIEIYIYKWFLLVLAMMWSIFEASFEFPKGHVLN